MFPNSAPGFPADLGKGKTVIPAKAEIHNPGFPADPGKGKAAIPVIPAKARIHNPGFPADPGKDKGIRDMLSTGVDIIEISRIAQTLERYGQRFLRRIYTPGELEYCRGRPSKLASRFAAKEAAMKALGTGVRGVGWQDIEVTRAPSGAPGIRLHGRAQRRAQLLGVLETSLSMSDSREHAVAFVVMRRQDPD